MTSRPFLTDLDARAAIKGSRDPLGLVPIWARLGRQVVGNLSTVSSSARDFKVSMLGFWFVERTLDAGSKESDLALFLKWEQLAGYATTTHGDKRPFRGIEAVRRNLADSSRVTLSADRAHQILGNQKIYGLWGLYTVPARTSGLVDGDPPRLTPEARTFVEAAFISKFARDGDAVVKLLTPPSARVDTARDDGVLPTIGKLLRVDRMPALERDFLDRHLVQGGPNDATEGRQALLAELFESTRDEADFRLSARVMKQLAKGARARQRDDLATRLDRIRHCESLLALAAAMFAFLLTRDTASVDDIVATFVETWGSRVEHLDLEALERLRGELGQSVGDVDATECWLRLANHLAVGDYADAIEDLLWLNAFVMKQRGLAAPWVELRKHRLHVAMKEEQAQIPKREELAQLWKSPYFLDSLRDMTLQVRAS